jgi:hypothetical protein
MRDYGEDRSPAKLFDHQPGGPAAVDADDPGTNGEHGQCLSEYL